jgi:tetratricopeptide (TPR) repeat protein
MGQPERRLAAWRELHGTLPASVLFSAHLALALWEGGAAEEGLRVLDSVTPGDGTNPEVLLDLGKALATYGRIEQGMAQIDRAVGAAAYLSAQAATTCAEAAEARVKAGDNAAAVVLYAKAKSLGPLNLLSSVRLGDLREAEGDYPGALGEFRAVVGGAPEAFHSAQRIDAIYERLNDPVGRLGAWREIVEAHPGMALPLLHLGLALEASGDRAGAREALERALKINPALAEAQGALGRLDNAAGDGKP